MKNGIQAEVKLGGVKKQPKDYFSGVIRQKATNSDKWHDLCSVSGTYLGYIQFDGVRYWDLRETQIQEVTGVPFEVNR